MLAKDNIVQISLYTGVIAYKTIELTKFIPVLRAILNPDKSVHVESSDYSSLKPFFLCDLKIKIPRMNEQGHIIALHSVTLRIVCE